MMKIGRLYREKFIQLIGQRSGQASAVFFVDFKGLTATQLNVFRQLLKEKNASLMVSKNRLIRKAFEGSNLVLDELLKYQTGVVYSTGDVVETAKILFDYKKEFDKLQIKGGVLKEKLLDAKQLESISKLPSREALLGMAVSCIASPITSFVNGLNQIILKFAWAIQEIKKKKEENS